MESNKLEYLGKECKDIVSNFVGICIGVVEWLYGCNQYILQSRSTDDHKNGHICFFFDRQLDLVGDGISERVAPPEYNEPRYLGHECIDKVTKTKGICVGRAIWLFSADQYVMEIQPEDMSKDSRTVWFDEGRLELVAQPERMITPEDVASPRAGGVLDAAFYPSAAHLNCR